MDKLNEMKKLVGKKPQDFLPRASVRFIRYEGTEEKTGAEMNVIKDMIFEGPVREQIDKSVAFQYSRSDSRVVQKSLTHFLHHASR